MEAAEAQEAPPAHGQREASFAADQTASSLQCTRKLSNPFCHSSHHPEANLLGPAGQEKRYEVCHGHRHAQLLGEVLSCRSPSIARDLNFVRQPYRAESAVSSDKAAASLPRPLRHRDAHLDTRAHAQSQYLSGPASMAAPSAGEANPHLEATGLQADAVVSRKQAQLNSSLPQDLLREAAAALRQAYDPGAAGFTG